MDVVVVAMVVAASVVAHEAAHAVAARAVGFRIFEFHIGVGPAVRRRFGPTDVAVSVLPIGGHVVAGGPSTSEFRWRAGFVAMAGSAANLALAGLGAIVGVRALVVFNLIAAASNLWPGRRAAVGESASDGRVALDLLRGDGDRILEEQSTWWAVPARRAFDAGDLDAAAGLVDDGIAAVGQARALRSIRAAVSFLRRDLHAAVDDFATLISDPALSETARGRVAADAAWAASLSGDDDLAPLALPWAEFARRLAPRDVRRRVIHGLALVDAGRAGDALAVLPDLPRDPSVAAVSVLARLGDAPSGGGGERAIDSALVVVRGVDGLAADHPRRQRVEAAAGRSGR